MEEYDYGYIKIKLDELLKERGISKNKLAHRAEMQRTQINNYSPEQYKFLLKQQYQAL